MAVKSSTRLLPEFTENGIDVDSQRKSPLPRWMIEGLNSFLTAGICDIVGYQESFFESVGAKALANRARTSRTAGGCYTGTPPGLVPSQTPPPFQGGQCDGVSYWVDFYYVVNGVRTDFSGNNLLRNSGPGAISAITWSYVNPRNVQGTIEFSTYSHPFIYKVSDQSPPFQDFGIDQIIRQDGQPDNCGSLPPGDVEYPAPTEVYPVPVPGQEILPPGIVEVPAPDTGINVPVGLAYGNVNINLDGSVSFDFGGIEVNINPDTTIDVGNGNGVEEGCNDEAFKSFVIDALNSLAIGLSDVRDGVDDANEELNRPLAGIISGSLCDETVISSEWSGLGISALSAQMSALSTVSNALRKDQCPVPPVEPGREIVPLGSFGGLDYRAFFDVDLPARTEVVFLDANSPNDPFAFSAGGGQSNDDVQNRFAQVSFLYPSEGNGFAVESGNQYYSKGAYRVPEWMPEGGKIRVSLYPRARVVIQALRRTEE